jgi:uncharacterized protein (DUF1330 family)
MMSSKQTCNIGCLAHFSSLKRQNNNDCILLSRLTTHGRGEYAKYADQFEQVFSRFDGKLLSVDEEPLVLAGEWEATRSVVIEFPSK